jgi:tetratricopeptide (TPR) repeat protein
MTSWRKIVATLALSASLAAAGAIVTKDGVRVEGDLKKADDGWDVVAPGGKITRVRASDIRTIELSKAAAPGMEGLYSLRRSVETTDDIAKIIERYKRFLGQSQDPAVDEEAKRDLATWQQRHREGMVRIGKKWVTPAEQHRMQLESYTLIDQAREQIQRNDLNGAMKTTSQMLALDPQQVSALYLQGVIAIKQGKLPDARKAFDAAREMVPDHAPTLYNVAAVLSRLKAWPAAAVAMEQSLAAEPNVQMLVDGAAELLNLIPDDQRKNPTITKLAARFAEQDAVVARQMAGKNQYRWGATWVDKPLYDKLLEADKAAKEKINKLQSDFDAAENRIIAIDAETKQNEITLREMESRSVARMSDGSIMRLPLPQAYYDLKQQQVKLVGERKETIAKLDTLRAAAKRAMAEFPVPKFTGVITPIGEDGVPVILPPGVVPPAPVPASQPTTKPAALPPIIQIGPGPGAMKNED